MSTAMQSAPTFDIFCPEDWVIDESDEGFFVRPQQPTQAGFVPNVAMTCTLVSSSVSINDAIALVFSALAESYADVALVDETIGQTNADRHVTFTVDTMELFQYQRCLLLPADDANEQWFIEMQATGLAADIDDLSPIFHAVLTDSAVEIEPLPTDAGIHDETNH